MNDFLDGLFKWSGIALWAGAGVMAFIIGALALLAFAIVLVWIVAF